MRHNPNAPRKVIAVDLDEVLARTSLAVAEFHNDTYGTSLTMDDFISYDYTKIWGGTREESILKWRQFFDSPYFLKVEPVEGSLETLKLLKSRRFSLVIVTARQQFVADLTKKFVDRHFPGIFESIYFANHFLTEEEKLSFVSKPKSVICRDVRAQLLIDDSLENAAEVARAGIPVLLFDLEGKYQWNKLEEGQTLPDKVTRVRSWKEIQAWFPRPRSPLSSQCISRDDQISESESELEESEESEESDVDEEDEDDEEDDEVHDEEMGVEEDDEYDDDEYNRRRQLHKLHAHHQHQNMLVSDDDENGSASDEDEDDNTGLEHHSTGTDEVLKRGDRLENGCYEEERRHRSSRRRKLMMMDYSSSSSSSDEDSGEHDQNDIDLENGLHHQRRRRSSAAMEEDDDHTYDDLESGRSRRRFDSHGRSVPHEELERLRHQHEHIYTDPMELELDVSANSTVEPLITANTTIATAISTSTTTTIAVSTETTTMNKDSVVVGQTESIVATIPIPSSSFSSSSPESMAVEGLSIKSPPASSSSGLDKAAMDMEEIPLA